MVQPTLLNVFYRYVFHYWDYQKYVFENMMVNEFGGRVYSCAPAAGGGGRGGCQCKFFPPRRSAVVGVLSLRECPQLIFQPQSAETNYLPNA